MAGVGLLVVLAALVPAFVAGLDNGVALTPPMGWNSWNHFHGAVSSEVMRKTADAFVALGLQRSGYVYINSDDGWVQHTRNSSDGRLLPGLNFPEPMPELAAYIHGRGLKFGLYSAAGMTTCMSRAGGLYHEVLDAQTFAGWGLDYLKYDDCGEVNLQSYQKFSNMRDALNATGRRIVFSYEPHATVPIGYPSFVGNLWRTGDDIGAKFTSMVTEVTVAMAWLHAEGRGAWGDMDMLEVGNLGLTWAEQRAHFALWCICKSPLIIGCDVTTTAPQAIAILNNTELIAINQDALGIPGVKVAAHDLADDELARARAADAAGSALPTNPRFEAARRLARLEQERAQTRAQASQAAAPAGGSLVTPCTFATTAATVPAAQQWSVHTLPSGLQQLQQGSGGCLSRADLTTLAACNADDAQQHWDAALLTTTSSQIRVPAAASPAPAGAASCLAINNASTAIGLELAPCAQEPAICSSTRCAASVLVSQLFYVSNMTRQLMSSYTDAYVPPLAGRAVPDHYAPMVSPCNASDAAQQWAFDPALGTLANKLDNTCLEHGGTAGGGPPALGLLPCTRQSTAWSWNNSMQQLRLADSPGFCLDAYNFTGPVVQLYACKPAPRTCTTSNQAWVQDGALIRLNNNNNNRNNNIDSTPCSHPEGLCLSRGPAAAPQPLINVPQCLAGQPNPAPPQPVTPPPAVNPALPLQIFAGPLAGGDVAVVLFNTASTNATITAHWSDLGLAASTKMRARDLYEHSDLGVFAGSISLPVGTHDVRALRLSRA